MIVGKALLDLASRKSDELFKVVIWSGRFTDDFIIGADTFKNKGLRLLQEMSIPKLWEFCEEILGIYGFIPAVIAKIRGSTLITLESEKPPYVYKIEPVRKVKTCLKDSVGLIAANKLHEAGILGEGVKVGVIDSGVDPVCSLKGKIVSYRNFIEDEEYGDYAGHGTHVAGIIAGDEEVYRGVAPRARIISAKVLNKKGRGSEELIGAGMMWTYVEGAEVINLSLGVEPDPFFGFLGDSGPKSFLSRLCDALASKGVVIVAAAGNDGPEEGTIRSPGASESAITVGAVDKHRKLTDYSSRGPVDGITKPDILAPGGILGPSIPPDEGIISTRSSRSERKGYPDECHTSLYGTSMAAPHVSGSAALILEAVKREEIETINKHFFVKSILTKSARDLGYKRDEQGAGLIDVSRALGFVRTYSEKDVVKEDVSLVTSELAPILVPTAIAGIASVFLGALLQPSKQNAPSPASQAKPPLQELYSQIDKILNALDERIHRLKEDYMRGIIPHDRYSEEMMKINSVLLKLNELIKRMR